MDFMDYMDGAGFTFEVKTAGADTFQLPLEATGTYAFNVDWGDGSSSDIAVWDHADTNHSYAGAGTYIVKITGTCYGWTFNNAGDISLLYDIKSWGYGVFRLGNSGNYFYGCSNLTVSATDALDLTDTTTFNKAFRGTSALLTIPSINLWDSSSITILNGCFLSSAFDQNIGSFVISSVTDATNFLLNSTMSTTNYSNTLIGFQAQSHQNNVIFSGGNSKTNAAGTTARGLLSGDGWIISDGGNE